MGQSVSNLGGAAMRIYDKVVHEQVFVKNVLWNNILRNVAHAQGSTTKFFSVHRGRNVGSAAGSETFTLPAAGNQQYTQAQITMKYNFHQLQLTDVALQASKRSKEFLVNALESEYNGAKDDMQRQLSRQGYGVGTGVICRVDDNSVDTTLSFDTPMVGKFTSDYFEVGTGVMFSASATSESSAAFTTISAITGNDDMTVTSASGIADDDYVYLAHIKASGAPSVSNLNAEVYGLKALIDDSTNLDSFETITRSTSIWWKSYVNSSATQRSLTEELMHTTYLEGRKKGNPSYGLTHFDVYSAFGQLLSPDRRYTSKMQLNGGFTGLEFNGLPIVPDYDCPFDELYFIDKSTLSVEDLAPISFLNEDGAILDRSSTTPAWNATLRYYAQLANSACNKSSTLRDVIK